ncbi:bifunctional DNA primase/polymerase [Nocardia grenadensis]|uniref:bifunctional DNA primase/polymerase n=1 Tax=Nocardia grenadensis TaxID=931537 RepID=UPI0007A52489|nr:bifunctional DNA primase/polymerase [Nocardia grenadensis]
MTEGFADAAPLYWNHSWRGVLLLPTGQKFPPPKDTTGYKGYFPSWPDIQAWAEENPQGNIGLRLPNTVIGLDVDHYKDKKGGDTLAEAERRWGPLPATVRSTSRIDGISGIRLFRIEAGTELETMVRFPELKLGDIEVVQFFHRYTVVWPSMHSETGRVYRWLTADGNPTTEIPRPGSLPMLPATWVEGLKRTPAAEITASGDVEQVLKSLPGGPMSPKVQQELATALTELQTHAGTRHDVTLRHILKLFRMAEQGGESGIREALEKLGKAFVAAVGKDRPGAQDEWDRMVRGQRGHDLIASTPSSLSLEQLMGMPKGTLDVQAVAAEKEPPRSEPDPQPAQVTPEIDPADAFLMGEESVFWSDLREDLKDPEFRQQFNADAFLMGEPDGSVEFELDGSPVRDDADAFLMGAEPVEKGTTESRTSWGPVDLDAILSGDFEPEQPTELSRDDGKRLIYPARVNCLAGEPESGKSWVAMHAAAQAMNEGRSVLYLDFEDSAKSIVGRLLALGVPASVLRQFFAYVQPSGHPSAEEGAWEELYGAMTSMRPDIIVLDGWNAAMTLLGLKLTDNTDATTFHQLMLKPLTATGAAVIAIDHVSKSKDGRGSFAIGAQAKKAMVDGAMYGVECVEQFGRGRLGKLELTVMKDKPGGIREFADKRKNGFYAGSVVVDARGDGAVLMRVIHEEMSGNSDDDLDKARVEMNFDKVKVSDALVQLEGAQKGVSQRGLVDHTGLTSRRVSKVVTELVDGGFVRIERGANRALLHYLVMPYKAPDTSPDDFLMTS